MWTLLRRLLCLNHDYGITAEPGTIFMRCRKCGHRTAGWQVDADQVNAPRPSAHQNAPLSQPITPALGLRLGRRAVRDA